MEDKKMDKCKKYDEMISLYCFNELSERDQKVIEVHMHTCQRCTTQLTEIKSTLQLVNKRQIPEMSTQFWEEYDAGLKEKLNKKPSTSSGIFNVDFSSIFLNIYRKSVPRFAYATIFLLILASSYLVIQQYQLAKKDKIDGVDTHIVKEDIKREDSSDTQIIEEAVQEAVTKKDQTIVHLSLEDELILQEMILLSELGEDVDLPLNDDDFIEDLEMIENLSSG